MTAPDPRLGEIEGRLAAATPGPWDHYGDLGHEVFQRTDIEDAEPGIAFDIPNVPDLGLAFRDIQRRMIKADEAATLKALLAAVQELGETPMFRLRPLPEARPKNWRPWHEHTLPNRRRR